MISWLMRWACGRNGCGEAVLTVRRGDDGFDFTGTFVRGNRSDRNIGLAWGDVPGDGTLRLFRGAKLRLADVSPELVKQALRPGHHWWPKSA
jgi:hypothetical protein